MVNSLLTADWHHQLAKCNKLYVGFSGGLDSTVLLYSLAVHEDLRKKLCAVHVHHGLSPNADVWQKHCEIRGKALQIPVLVYPVKLAQTSNIEEAARDARHDVFKNLLTDSDCLLLGHHANDQAETLLLQLFRGAGVDGLASMPSVRKYAKGKLVRPLLSKTRQELEQFAEQHGLVWINDESNQNDAYSRNFLRNQVLPLLQERWPSLLHNLGRSAQLFQEAKHNLEALAAIDYPQLEQPSLPLAGLSGLTTERIRNLLRAWLKKQQIRLPSSTVLTRIVTEVIHAREDAEPHVTWGNYVVKRYQGCLYLQNHWENDSLPMDSVNWPHFPAPLYLNPHTYLKVINTDIGLSIPAGAKISIRFRRGGEMFRWHGQTKQLKKLLQEWKIPPWQRAQIPLLYVNGQLAAVVGYAVSDDFYQSHAADNLQVIVAQGAI